ncbi:MAG: Holliday junction branch migration protein RuvA [Planctomycetota bacterium]
MYDYLTGIVREVGEDFAVIEAAGAGYRLRVPASTASTLRARISTETRVYLVCRLREELFQLYGFATRADRRLFELMCNVTGVGPAIALAVLSGISFAEFQQAILLDQPRQLERIKGVGRKTAQRLVLELKDSLSKTAGFSDESVEFLPVAGGETGVLVDATSALIQLGFSPAEAETTVRRLLRESATLPTLEEVVRAATSGAK